MIFGDAYIIAKFLNHTWLYMTGNNDGEFQWSSKLNEALLVTKAKADQIIKENMGFFAYALDEELSST